MPARSIADCVDLNPEPPRGNPLNASGTLELADVGIGELSDVDLRIAPGEVVCLSGPSGSGKTRLLRAIADLEPHRGRIRLGDLDQSRTPADRWRRAVMLVPAESQWWGEQVGEHFSRPMPDALEALGFSEAVNDWEVTRLSSGEKQRLALVRALARDPEALLLDEPTANLDDENTRRVEDWLTGLIERRRLPVVWVAHAREQIARVADRHCRIAGGRLETVS